MCAVMTNYLGYYMHTLSNKQTKFIYCIFNVTSTPVSLVLNLFSS